MTKEYDFRTSDPYFITDWTGLVSPIPGTHARLYSSIDRAQAQTWVAHEGPFEFGMHLYTPEYQRFWWLQSLN